ncbi:long-chain-fatty-acid--CoA ligase 4-like [Brevipalpus obovatus]|uniref:long-chain-fatty-acid--CoA ligase 4-like n=1 Tax=Brevipalpus obovatus TaxID=246614 RepID=UPI003D9EEDE7
MLCQVIKIIPFIVLWYVTSIVDIILLPLHFLIQRPLDNYHKYHRKWIKTWPPISETAEVFGGLLVSEPLKRCSELSADEERFEIRSWKTMCGWLEYITKKHGDKPCLGTRAQIAEVTETDENGKATKKVVLADEYKFITFSEVMDRVNIISQSLQAIGIKSKQIVPIIAENREEWVLISRAVWKVDATLATILPNSGTDSIIHVLNATEASHVFTSQKFLSKFRDFKAAGKLPHLQTIIYFPDISFASEEEYTEDFKLISYQDLLTSHYEFQTSKQSLTTNGFDIALIMYTSGSTGVPKGVMITHNNLIATMKGFLTSVMVNYELKENEIYLSLLPLSHVYEFAAQTIMLTLGIPIAFSSPATFITGALGLTRDSQGDANLVRPTLIPCVPLILERIRRSIEDKIKSKPSISIVFHFCLQYKKFWHKFGFNTPLVDRLIFSSTRDAFGGRIRMMFTGGAPLLGETHEFISLVMNVKLLQAYASTETTAGGFLMDLDDRSYGRCGAPLNGVTMRLVEWEEGGYSPKDKPNPRGEVYIGGPTVALGYYRDEKETKSQFLNDPIDKMRYWISGDIAELFPDGTIRIIDRRKDLVKLFNGEYISLGKVETVFKNCPLIDNICVHGSFSKPYVIALICPDRENLAKLVDSLGKSGKSFEDQCRDEQIIKAFLDQLTQEGVEKGLARFEIPRRILICSQEWTQENGLITGAMKIRRHEIKKYYEKEIEVIYEQ